MVVRQPSAPRKEKWLRGVAARSGGEEWRRGAAARGGAAARDKEALSVQDANVFTALIYLISE